MKTLVTHINPHLDDIVGIWLFKKYNSEFADANVEFISASRDAGGDTEEKIFIGTGGGQFDEHKEGLNTCAGSLVFDYLKAAGNIPDLDAKYNSVQYFSPEKDISAIYEKVKEKDPEASWFLHQSHHMVICGSSSAPDSKPTKLSMEELIEAAK